MTTRAIVSDSNPHLRHPNRLFGSRWMIAAASLLGTCALTFAGPIERGLIPADPAMVIHVDLEAARQSALGTHVLENRQAFNLGALDGLKAFGIDVTKDLLSATVVTNRNKPDTGVVIVRSTSSVDTLWSHLQTEPHAKPLNVGGYDILSWSDGGEKKYGVVRKGAGASAEQRTIYIAEDWELIVGALQAADGKAPTLGAPSGPTSVSPNPALLVDMRQVPEDMRKPGDVPAQALFGALRNGTLEIGELESKPYVRAIMNYDAPQTASDMREVAEGLSAFAKLAARSEPPLAPLAKAMDGMKIDSSGTSVTISGSWTQDQARALLATLAAMDKHNKGNTSKNKPDDKSDDKR